MVSIELWNQPLRSLHQCPCEEDGKMARRQVKEHGPWLDSGLSLDTHDAVNQATVTGSAEKMSGTAGVTKGHFVL